MKEIRMQRISALGPKIPVFALNLVETGIFLYAEIWNNFIKNFAITNLLPMSNGVCNAAQTIYIHILIMPEHFCTGVPNQGNTYMAMSFESEYLCCFTAAVSNFLCIILNGKVITAEVYEGQADKTIEVEKENLRSYRDNIVKAALARIGEEFKVFTDYRISDVELDIRLSKSNLKESISKKIDAVQIAKLLPVLKSAIENAVCVECHANRYFYDNNTSCLKICLVVMLMAVI